MVVEEAGESGLELRKDLELSTLVLLQAEEKERVLASSATDTAPLVASDLRA